MDCNRYNLAIQELSSLDLGTYKIPKTVADAEVNTYVCVGIKSRDSIDKTTKIHTAVTVLADIAVWQKNEMLIKNGTIKEQFAGIYNKVIIVHNPTEKAEVKAKADAPKLLSPTQKAEVKALLLAGDTAEAIATKTGVELERIKAFIDNQ